MTWTRGDSWGRWRSRATLTTWPTTPRVGGSTPRAEQGPSAWWSRWTLTTTAPWTASRPREAPAPPSSFRTWTAFTWQSPTAALRWPRFARTRFRPERTRRPDASSRVASTAVLASVPRSTDNGTGLVESQGTTRMTDLGRPRHPGPSRPAHAGPAHRDGTDPDRHPAGHPHTHGQLDPGVLATARGISAVKWSFAG